VDQEPLQISLLTVFYAKYLDKQDTAEFISNVSRFYTQGTLQRLTESERPESRRAAALALGFLGNYEANHQLGRLLHDDDNTVRLLAENAIRSVWTRAGNDDEHKQLKIAIRHNSNKQYEEAIEVCDELIEKAPWFAEAWNQRGIAYFGKKDYLRSMHDAHQALEINPYHFGAAVGMGQAYTLVGEIEMAIECFQRALRLNPNMEGVREHLLRLAKKNDQD
jgi:tetratricopeptide (TPR) repeat protein